MSKNNLSLSKKNVASYFMSLLGVVALVIVLTWILASFWYSLFLIHIALSTCIFGIYVLAWIYCLYIAYRIIGLTRSRPFGSKKVANRYLIPSLILLATAMGTYITLASPSWIPADMYPHLSYTGDPATSMTLTWYSTNSYVGRATYGTSPSNLSLVVQEPGATMEHVLNFTGLNPDTRYYYRIDQFGITWSFKTASNQLNVVTFLAIADIHSMFYPPMVPAMIAKDPDFAVAVGDLVDYGASNAQWSEYFNLLAPIETNYSIMTAIGNHDSMLVGDQNYIQYLSMPRASTGSERYYHFKYNGVHFFCLDLEWGLESYDAGQRDWFENELDSVPLSDWVIIYDHCMHISSGGFGNATGDLFKLYNTAGDVLNTFHDQFVQHDVDLVISGHDHHFEISNYDGVVYAIVGTANTRLDSASPTNNTDSIYYEPGYSGFTEVQINDLICTISGFMYDSSNSPKPPFVYCFTK
nr:metallophosphoesterase family protein [Candidatus Sigynarchaeota archaeon]